MLEKITNKKQFVDTAWLSVEHKLDAALNKIHGNARSKISEQTFRSANWWRAIQDYLETRNPALYEHFKNFKCISDAKHASKNGAEPSLDVLQRVNSALKSIADYTEEHPSTVSLESVLAAIEELSKKLDRIPQTGQTAPMLEVD
jgi:hypothetical protein